MPGVFFDYETREWMTTDGDKASESQITDRDNINMEFYGPDSADYVYGGGLMSNGEINPAWSGQLPAKLGGKTVQGAGGGAGFMPISGPYTPGNPAPPTTETAPPTLGGSNQTWGDLSNVAQEALWETDPQQAFYNALGIGAYGLTPFQKWQANQFNPFYGTYLAQARANAGGGGVYSKDASNFLANTGITGARSIAPNVFNQIGGLEAVDQRDLWDTLGSFGRYFTQNVLGQKYGYPIASSMGQNYSGIQSAFQGNEGMANENASFLDYLRNKYGI
ncbi:MAG: hypothetical protein WC455_15650 [Dehalococcoidia bacterium]|jgi:hypothetical protein